MRLGWERPDPISQGMAHWSVTQKWRQVGGTTSQHPSQSETSRLRAVSSVLRIPTIPEWELSLSCTPLAVAKGFPLS